MADDVKEHGLADRLAALRAEGAWRADPVRFRTLEALARRIPAQREPVQRLLESKLAAALAEYAAAAQPVPTPIAVRRTGTSAAVCQCKPLAELNAYLRQLAAARMGASDGADPSELASVRRFRQAWDRQRTLEQLQQAVSRTPANAGPLNSHALVLRSLELMAALSPDYLRHFMVHAEALQWLERATEQSARDRAPDRKKPNRARRKK